jgi:hypothetical protein
VSLGLARAGLPALPASADPLLSPFPPFPLPLPLLYPLSPASDLPPAKGLDHDFLRVYLSFDKKLPFIYLEDRPYGLGPRWIL